MRQTTPEPPLALVVEDHPDLRELVGEALSDAGFRVTLAREGREALDLLLSGLAPAVVVLDLMMPVMDGSTLLRHLRALPYVGSVPVVAMSAARWRKDETPGVQAFVEKPFDTGQLVETVERVLASGPLAAAR